MPPVLTPITVADAKAHANITHADRDALVLNWILAATQKVERDTELALMPQTWDLALNRFPDGLDGMVLPLRPLQSVTSIKYYDTAGALQTITGSDYVLEANTLRIWLAVNATWPSNVRLTQSLIVRVVAGYATEVLVPEDLKQAIRLLVGHFSEHRQAAQAEDRPQLIDLGYESLIAPYVQHRAA